MCKLRICGIIAVLLLLGVGLGGCPSAFDSGATNDPAESLSEEGAGDGTISLNALAAQIVAADAVYGTAWSTESTTISINPNIDVGDEHERIHTPWLSTHTSVDTSGVDIWWWLFGIDEETLGRTGDSDGPDDGGDDGSTDGADDGGDDDDGSEADDGADDDDGSDEGDDWDEDDCFDADDDPGRPPGTTGFTVYEGIADCANYQELIGYGEGRSTDECYLFALARNERGALGNIPIPVACTDEVMLADVHVVGDSDTQLIPFSDEEFTVTVRVVSASYAGNAASLVLELDSSWIGEHAGIVSRGEQTLRAQLVSGSLVYSSSVHWEVDLWASDEWSGDAIDNYDFYAELSP